MCPRFTLVGLGTAMFLQPASFAASDLKERSAEPPTISEQQARGLAIYTPSPNYPYEARVHRLSGGGFVRLEIDTRTGIVTSARMLQSTGQAILDQAALEAFRQWRFKSGTLSAVKIPVRFSMMRHSPAYGTLSATAPKYPREARDKGLTGSGVVMVRIDPRTGYVTSAWMLKSTGHDVLDRAAIDAFRLWHFKPRTVTTAEIPVRFTTKGVVF